MKLIKITVSAALLLSLFWTSCTPETQDTDPNSQLKTDIINNYCEVVYASYDDAHSTAVELQTALNIFVDNPTQTTFDAAKSSWIAAREPYGQTEAYRFYDGPIDDSDGPEGNLNAWPLDENYIDYTFDANGTAVYTGMINDTISYPTLSASVISGANEGTNPWVTPAPASTEKNISIGYHAIECLLWGQDYMDVNVNVGQGGNRSYTDYTNAADNYVRRGEYLKICAQLLIDDLAILKSEWAASGSYRNYFTGLNADEALTKILTGVGILSKSELAGERMFTALETNTVDNPQEDEHSCFSDNTHRDVITNALGIYNVLFGTYTSSNGVIVGNSSHSFIALFSTLDVAKSLELSTAAAEVLTKVNAIPVPFDKTVTEENVADNGPVSQAINALQAQGDLIAVCASLVGLNVSTALPE